MHSSGRSEESPVGKMPPYNTSFLPLTRFDVLCVQGSDFAPPRTHHLSLSAQDSLSTPCKSTQLTDPVLRGCCWAPAYASFRLHSCSTQVPSATMLTLRLPTVYLSIPNFVLLQLARAQNYAPIGIPPLASSITATSGSASSAVSLSPAALSSDAIPVAAIPTFTDSATPPVDTDDAPANHSVLRFYFFFLAVFIIAIVILYWVLRRKRRRLYVDARRRQQDALAADLRRWSGNGVERPPRGTELRTGRWHRLRPIRTQEGLNECGEAPPAYVAKPEPAHSATGAASTPPEWVEMMGKPPDYEGMRHS